MTTPVLTRYLYVKDQVQNNMLWAILNQEEDVAMFWAYELYFSGFETETVELLLHFAHVFYQENHMTIVATLNQWYHESDGSTGSLEHVLGNMILTLSHNHPSFSYVLRGRPPCFQPPSNDLYRMISDHQIAQYQTQCVEPQKSWKFLRSVVSIPSTPMTMETEESIDIQTIVGMFHTTPKSVDDLRSSMDLVGSSVEKDVYQLPKYVDNWMYCASFSPLWKERIATFHGIIDHDDQTVLFDDEDQEENFLELYGYEPDEQPLEVQRSLWPSQTKTISWSEFCNTYGSHNLSETNVIVRRIKG